MSAAPLSPWETLKILLLCIFAAVAYGITHDQITARICPEYFTVAHPDLGMPAIFHSPSPTVLGLAWGVVATWWVGLAMGVLLALCAQVGRLPRQTWRDLRTPVAVMLGVTGVLAAAAGMYQHLAIAGAISTTPHEATQHWLFPRGVGLPDATIQGLYTDLATHLASYAGGVLGALLLCSRTVWKRYQLARAAVAKSTG